MANAHRDTRHHLDVTTGDGGNPLGIPSIILSLVLLAALAHPNPLLLPILSALFVTVGFGIACGHWLRHRRTPSVMVEKMSLAGLLVFFGFAAAVFSDPDAVAQSLTYLR
jgi:ABC-type xylose transport system permease subunit